MGMFKKALALVLVAALSATAAVGGTLAYLQSEDSDVNVMTLGNVKIEQIEQERDANGELVDFTQAKPAFPAVGTIAWDETNVTIGDGEYKVFDSDLKNVVDKIVTVKNTGKSDAYVRTIIALEVPGENDPNNLIHVNVNGNIPHTGWKPIKIDGLDYVYSVFTYEDALKPNEISAPSLLQVFLDSKATNDDCAKFGNTWEILTLSQAVQTQGFENAQTALDTAFGEADAANAVEWFGGMYVIDYSIPAAEIGENGIVTLNDGESRVLSGKVTSSVTVAGTGKLYLRDLEIKADTGSALTIAAGSNVELIVENNVTLTGADDGHGVYVPANTTLNLSGKGGSLTAIGNAGVDDEDGAHGIGGEGTINIRDMKALTAEGYGVNGFGIGGATTSVTVTNTTIKNVQGGYVQPNLINDTSYGKSEPEGGAAIGSSTDGAVITLTNVTVENAEGGSKSAGIGARYWTGVTINIDNCEIKNVVGGNASAGIGGSRVAEDASSYDAVTINIKDSKVTATGGEFGAGIGSGYDTHCNSDQPVHTINITGNSVINAQGGKYAAGIGTGYHVASLAGKIESTVTVNAKAGAGREKYTVPMDVGFGVIDKSKEGNNSESSFDNKGTTVTVSSAPDVQ